MLRALDCGCFIIMGNTRRSGWNELRGINPSGIASLPDYVFFDRFAIWGTLGLPPQALPEGFHPSDSLLRFALF